MSGAVVVSFAQLSSAQAQTTDKTYGDRFEIEGQLSADVLVKKDGSENYQDNLRTRNTEIKFTGKIAENVRLVVKTMLDMELRRDGANVSPDFDIQRFIKEAYIRIDNVGGQPIAFIVGKQEIAFGQNSTEMPIFHNTPIYDIAKEDQVIGFTVALNKNLFGLIDSVEASVFETTAGDLDIGTIDGASIRLSKALTDKLSMKVSAMRKGVGSAAPEDRASVGLVYKSGEWTAWAEGIYMRNNAQYADADFAVSGGVARDLGPGTVAVEATWIQDSLTQMGVGYKLYLTKNVMVGPELRYTVADGSDLSSGELTAGARTEVTIGKKAAKRYLFNKN